MCRGLGKEDRRLVPGSAVYNLGIDYAYITESTMFEGQTEATAQWEGSHYSTDKTVSGLQ